MSKGRKHKVNHEGSKVRVPAGKRHTAPRRDRQRDHSAPVDVTPVDYQPPGSEEERPKSIREAGYRDGRNLVLEDERSRKGGNGAPEDTGRQEKASGSPSSVSTAPESPAPVSDAAPNGAERKQETNAPDVPTEESTADTPGDEMAFGFTHAQGAYIGAKQRGKKAGRKMSETAGDAAGNAARPRPTVPRTVIMALSALFMLYALSPLAVGVVTVGILPPLCIGAFFFTVAYFWPKICACKKPWFNALFIACGLAVIAGITVIFYLFGQMYAASAVRPPANRSDYTVVVLGCKTIGNRPSLMLKDRLDAAAEFLTKHPGAYCVVSGGQGDDELAPESTIMKRYLVSKGISELRIVEEKNSSTTEENIAYSCAMLDECNLYSDIVVVTDRFHQYRARHYLTRRGLRCYAVNSETRWYLAPHYWFKEMVAVAMLMMGMEIH